MASSVFLGNRTVTLIHQPCIYYHLQRRPVDAAHLEDTSERWWAVGYVRKHCKQVRFGAEDRLPGIFCEYLKHGAYLLLKCL